jgi:Ca2+-binding EF-hand superfamily protein
LFNKLKNAEQKIDIQVLISNITGTENDTVDFKNKLFKQLYKDIIARGSRKQLLNILESHDDSNDGTIHPEKL